MIRALTLGFRESADCRAGSGRTWEDPRMNEWYDRGVNLNLLEAFREWRYNR